MVTIETPRLLLRSFLIEDAEVMFELDSNPEVLKYIGTPVLTDIEQSRDVIRFIQKQYEENGVGRLAVFLKETNEFIGWSGLKLITELTNNQINYYDVGYRFIPRYWGKGFATEAAKASVDFGFETLKADKICAIAMPENLSSRNVLAKCGLQFINEFTHENQALVWYEKLKQQSNIVCG